MPSSFAHLHVHSEYSLGDGGTRIPDLLQRVSSLGQNAVALTDHDNLFAAIEFYRKAKDKGIKAIVGAEVTVTGIVCHDPAFKEWAQEESLEPAPDRFHLVLLAKNLTGYKNLLKIVSEAHLHADPTKEKIVRVPTEFLLRHGEGLFLLTSCLLGEFAYLAQLMRKIQGNSAPLNFLTPDHPATTKLISFAQRFRDQLHQAFGVDHVYAELIDNNLPEQKKYVPDIASLAQFLNLPIVATADAHYLKAEDADSHAVLLAIKNELKVSAIGNRRQNAEFHVLDNEEFELKYQRWPEAISNTLKIADQCDLKLDFNTYYLPKFDLGSTETPDDGLRRLAKEGLEERFKYLDKIYGSSFGEEQKKPYRTRLEYETEVIIKMGFPGYFLIVQDFINWAKRNDIPVGPGRGSGAGSIVAYALRITDLDPIPYNLLFERFLNPERVSMPDFDVDFCQDRRDEVIKYVIQHYGWQNVAQITTFGKMQAKAVVRDVGRALEIGYTRVDKIAKLIPNEIGITLKDAYDKDPRIKQEAAKDPRIAELLRYAEKLEGLSRHCSVHAAGLVISDGDMRNYVPVYRGDDGGLITHFEKDNVEKVGLVKFDFLGLKTLTVIDKAVKIIRVKGQPSFDIALIPIEDPKVYKEISTANTCGLFQLESRGMQQLIAKLQPSKFEDLVAVVALFRPGPLGSGMVDDFIERKHGRQKIIYPLPLLEPILRETYGIILYQEQVQRIASDLAGYSLGEADMLRRAMGKKKPEEMAKQKDRFMKGAHANQINPNTAGDLFELMSKFAEYGFNKSHSAAYGLVSYQTAYLKTYHPEAFMAAIMTCDLDNTDKVIRYVAECRRMGFKLLPPNINRSEIVFDVIAPKTLGFGLGAIKGIGLQALVPLVEERQKNGVFKTLSDFAKRVNLMGIGKKTLELLNESGALDTFGYSRAVMASNISALVKHSQELHSAKLTGQLSLFTDMGDESTNWEPENPVNQEDLKANLWLNKEKIHLGVYISGHPLDLFVEDQRLFRTKLDQLPNKVGEKECAVLCVVSDAYERLTKTGKKMLVTKLEDHGFEIECIQFQKNEQETKLPPVGQVVTAFISAEKSFDGSIRYKLDRWVELETFRNASIKGISLNFKPIEASSQQSANTPAIATQKNHAEKLTNIKNILSRFPGNLALRIGVESANAKLVIEPESSRIFVSNDLLQSLRHICQSDFEIRYL